SRGPCIATATASGTTSSFVSSRRRHTRFSRDWSSDVCSSDLASRAPKVEGSREYDGLASYAYHMDAILFGRYLRDIALGYGARQIGRASCREREVVRAGAVGVAGNGTASAVERGGGGVEVCGV